MCSLQIGQLKGCSKNSSLTGARQDRSKKVFAYHSPRLKLATVPSRKKIDMQKVLASLNTPCPKCGHEITPAEIKRVSWTEMECPKCGLRFDAAKANGH